MSDIQSGANRGPGIVSGRLDIDLLERLSLKDFSISSAVKGYTPGQAELVLPSLFENVVEEGEVVLLEDFLN